MIEMDIAVTISPAVNQFNHERMTYETCDRNIPEALYDAWEQLMRVRDHAEDELVKLYNLGH